jgi:nitroimidazol reductase NimA-like FMN-containing flavoprotein (pyridoxamine 5'-phosphate oxidase superfamily)
MESGMQDTNSAMVELSAEECRNLLARHRPRLGRLAFVAGGWPLVLPVNYVADRAVIYIRTAPGSKLLAALNVQQVTFEVDYVDEVWEEGWSVLAFGRLRVVTEEDELADVARRPLRPWARGDRPYYLRLDISRLSGRRLV